MATDLYDSKLIVLRGNSGSGKSSVARELLRQSPRRVAYVEQDYIRQTVLRKYLFKPTDLDRTEDVLHLLGTMIHYLLSKSYDVIFEGILNVKRYGPMLKELAGQTKEHYFYYWDIPFEESVRRHASRSTANEYGEAELREWWKQSDLLGLERETVITGDCSLAATVEMIATATGITAPAALTGELG